jgi:hypothetical protein
MPAKDSGNRRVAAAAFLQRGNSSAVPAALAEPGPELSCDGDVDTAALGTVIERQTFGVKGRGV